MAQNIASTHQVSIERIRPHSSIKVKQEDISLKYLDQCEENGAILEPSLCLYNSSEDTYTLMGHPWAWHAAQMLCYPTIPVVTLSEPYGGYTPYAGLNNGDLIDDARKLYKCLQNDKTLTVTKLAIREGIDRSTLAHTLQLLNLTSSSVVAYRRRLINKGHLKRLSYLKPSDQELALSWLKKKKKPKVKELEEYIRTLRGNKTPAQVDKKDPDMVRLENKISEHFGCEASIEAGKLTLDYCEENSILEGILEKSGFQF